MNSKNLSSLLSPPAKVWRWRAGHLSSKKGFTLVEVLVATAIIGILASFVISNFPGTGQKIRDSQRKNDLTQLQTALGLYFQDHGSFPPAINNGKINWGVDSSAYIKKLPKDPVASEKDYFYQPDGRSYRLYAKLENCNDQQAKAGEDCANDYNYCVSPDGSCLIGVAISPTPAPIVIVIPSPTPTPGITVVPTTSPTPISSPTPTSTPIPLPQLRVFVTSTKYTGDLKTAANSLPGDSVNGLSAGDKICQNRADAAGLDGRWKAWLSDTFTNAKDRIHNGVYKRLDNQIVANNKADLTNGNINVPIDRDENNVQVIDFGGIGGYVWTGTGFDGLSTGSNCNSWQNGDFNTSGSSGYLGKNDFSWSSVGGHACSEQSHIYCFEQEEQAYIAEGYTFMDTNRNQIKDVSESCYNGSVTVSLSGVGSKTYNQDPDCVNKYRFTELPAGTYTVSMTNQFAPAYNLTTPSSQVVTFP